MPSKRYANRKRRMAKDPEFKEKIMQAQTSSRRRATERRWEEHVEQHGPHTCWHVYPNNRRCWKTYRHFHGASSHGGFGPADNETS